MNSDVNYSAWCLYSVSGSDIKGMALLAPNGNVYNQSATINPVISMPLDIIDIEAGYNSTTGWTIK